MSNRKTWKSVGALLLTVAMLAGMLSVMGALPATAKTTTAMKFTADFSELSRIVTDNGGTFTDGKYRAPFTPRATPLRLKANSTPGRMRNSTPIRHTAAESVRIWDRTPTTCRPLKTSGAATSISPPARTAICSSIRSLRAARC